MEREKIMKKQKFNHMLALVSTMTLVAGSHAVYAQQAAQEAEEIVVTGFKASLEKAQELKKGNSSIVEAVVAEDIGKLPDSSIAETLARLPGLAGERVNGRTSGLSLRGLLRLHDEIFCQFHLVNRPAIFFFLKNNIAKKLNLLAFLHWRTWAL